MLMYPEWTNTSDFLETPETFGTVRLHSSELAAAMNKIRLPADIKFTPDQQYLCKCMGTPAPLLPVHGEVECKLFEQMIRNGGADPDFDPMAIKWCDHVDGNTVFPKLPVYLRTHHKTWQRNQRVKETVTAAALGEEAEKRP